MSQKERICLEALGRVQRKEITVVRAAELAGISVRQMHRYRKRFAADGAAGLVHRGRGKPAHNRIADEMRAKIMRRFSERYADFGPTFACEKLKVDGYDLSADTLSSLLKAANLWQPRRKRSKHRSRRDRRRSFGDMVQMDGSRHDWFEGRGEPCTLMVAIDDANNTTMGAFHPHETLDAAFDLFEKWVAAHGLPRALYVDRYGIYRCDREPTAEEILDQTVPVTQFGRAMKELGVELIMANSPQAKGRVERKNGVLQDRLVKEMRLAGICSIADANAFLPKFFADLQALHPHQAADGSDAHRAVETGVQLAHILCEKEDRIVGKDWCVRCNNQWMQIDAMHQSLALPRKKVLVIQPRNGDIVLQHNGENLQYMLIKKEQRVLPKPPKPVIKNNKSWKPPASHPWKQNYPTPMPATSSSQKIMAPT